MKWESGKQDGVALVIVLGLLVIILGLAVTFLNRTSIERNASASYAATASTRQLADTAVNLVQAQIRDATSLGSTVAWASQPGMIRTFGSGSPGSYTASPNALLNYKLYSSLDMVTTSTNFSGDSNNSWAAEKATWTDINAPITDAANVKKYPIMDPPPSNSAVKVPGFSINSAPGATTNQPAPMPVRWLYVLQDGKLVAPVTDSGNKASVDGAVASSNPIIGRIAFWTDDETCKVNINTASEGTYWDMPRATVVGEQKLGSYQPTLHEWQRYPGHPAMTSLSTVFPTLTAQQIFALTPRINGGGSDAGTVAVNTSGMITADTDRLYATVDELSFAPSRATTALTQDEVEKAKFFLTAQSRAPEVNLYGAPRVACWPIYKDLAAGYVTPFDKLIAFCSTINREPYYFQRQENDNPTNDFGIARNALLYSYLQKLTETPAPGFGASLLSKYAKRDQILTEIFDYIRSTNLADDNVTVKTHRFTAEGRNPSELSTIDDTGSVIPSKPANGTMGFGRAYTLSELAIGFICNATADDPSTPLPVDESAGSNTVANPVIKAEVDAGRTPLATGEIMVQAVVIPDFFSVMQGWVGLNMRMRMTVSGLSNFTLNGQPLYSSDTATLDYYRNATSFMQHGRGWGGAPGWRSVIAGRYDPASFPLASTPIRLTPSSGKMNFSGGNITVTLSSHASGNPIYQTFHLNLPPALNLPAPKIADTDTNDGKAESPPDGQKQRWWSIMDRANDARKHPGGAGNRRLGAFFREEYDVVQGIVLKHGDFRVVAAQQTINDPTNQLYKPLTSYGTLAISSQLSHFTTGVDLINVGGTLDPKRKYFSWGTDVRYIYPDASADNRPEATGDVDNGLAAAMDGPYINKPDEGNISGAGDYLGANAPYFWDTWSMIAGGTTYFSPNRMMPSPGMFGSLPTGIIPGDAINSTPWRTLLFRSQGSDFPGAAATGLTQHPGSISPPDHLFLDLFWMPVVEPYAVSEPFSTAGKVNMNYQIQPFHYIERSTALRAVFKAEKLAAILNTEIGVYKSGGNIDIRKEIDVNNAASATEQDTAIETLNQFAKKFAAGEVFKSASEICDLHIVPTGQTVAGMPAYWNNAQLTGDNLRERIYTTLYPRLTTKSNTYTVHYRVQSLKKAPGAPADSWDEAEPRDKVTGEYRGSTTIERYINPNDDQIPNYPADLAKISSDPISKYYKWRVLNTRQFAP